MKKVFELISDSGDGSYHVNHTMDETFVAFLKQRYDRGECEHDDMGCDGDGFHYSVLSVPVECTPESMGFTDVSLDDAYANDAGVWRKLSFDEQYLD